MKKVKDTYIIFVIITLLLAVSIASSLPFRFYPIHKIVKQVFCISCHEEELNDLKEGKHIRIMDTEQNKALYDYIDLYGNDSEPAKTLIGSCYTCHITYQNSNYFGLTDPYAYIVGTENMNIGGFIGNRDIVDAQYGYVIPWSSGDNVEYFAGNTAITLELEVLSIEPADSGIDTTMKLMISNYSGQQNGTTSFDFNQVLYDGETMVVKAENIYPDYFKITLILDGLWNNTMINLRINGTDQGDKSYFITANNHPFVYELPYNDTGAYYYMTNGTYKAVRLDYILSEWMNYSMRNITSSEIIRTNSSIGLWTNASTCSAPDAMCHINQKATYIGLNDGLNSDKVLYPHSMRSVTSEQCKICHLGNKPIITIE